MTASVSWKRISLNNEKLWHSCKSRKEFFRRGTTQTRGTRWMRDPKDALDQSFFHIAQKGERDLGTLKVPRGNNYSHWPSLMIEPACFHLASTNQTISYWRLKGRHDSISQWFSVAHKVLCFSSASHLKIVMNVHI